jgi:uncharacterized protein (TIGR03435 family)
LAVLGVVLHAQDASRPRFEVASVKRNTTRDTAAVRVTPGRVRVSNMPLTGLVTSSYRVEAWQVVGGPDWIGMERWDIAATAPDETSQVNLDAMMRSLLADRFKLSLHTETRMIELT